MEEIKLKLKLEKEELIEKGKKQIKEKKKIEVFKFAEKPSEAVSLYDPIKSIIEYKKKEKEKFKGIDEMEMYMKFCEKKQKSKIDEENAILETNIRLVLDETAMIDRDRKFNDINKFENSLIERYGEIYRLSSGVGIESKFQSKIRNCN